VSEILEFISRVAPWGQDLVNLHWKVPGKPFMPGLPFKTPEDFLAYAQYANTRPKLYGDLYYCLSSQLKTGPEKNGRVTALRVGDNVAAFKAIWLDVDGYKAEKGYANLGAALEAIKQFVSNAKLPAPTALVCSGGGWHVYWISEKPLTEDEWRPYAEGLWALAVKHGLRADAGVTTDSVRVLRVPGTLNHKPDHTATVKLVALAATDYAFESTLYAIKAPEGLISHMNRSRAPRAAVCNEDKFIQQAPVDGLETIGLAWDFDLPLAWEPLLAASGCPHLLEAYQTGGAHYAQPLWHLDALLSTFLQDGQQIFRLISKSHPAYDRGAADAMFDRKVNEKEKRSLGWPSCAAIESAGCTSCKACPHKGQIRSPLNLTRPAATPFLPKTDDVSGGIYTTGNVIPFPKPFEPNPNRLPRHYKMNEKGQVCERIAKFDAAGKPHDVWEPLIENKIWGPYIASDPIALTSTLNFTVITDLGKTRDIAVPFQALRNKDTFAISLYDQQVMIVTGKEEAAVKFARAWTTILRETIEASEMAPDGWVTAEGGDPVGFIYGGHLYKKDGTERPSGRDSKFKAIYSPYGKEDVWFKALDLVTLQKRMPLEAVVASSFASPLLYMTGQRGGVLAAIGKGGGNKSTAVDLGNAVWGKPILAKAILAASNKGITKQMTELHNLPVYWDDIKNDRLVEAVKMINQATEGQGGIHLKSNREFAENGTWQSILTVCANGNIIDTLLKTSKTDAASLYRVFQFHVPKVPDDWPGRVSSTIAKPLQALLDYNYGCVGARYAKWLGSHPDEIRASVLAKQAQFSEAIGEKQEERFWVALCASVYCGAQAANEALGANFHLPELWDFLVDAFLKLRERVESEHLEGGTEINTEAYLTGFLKGQGRYTLITWDMVKGAGKPLQQLRIIDQPDFVRYPDAHVDVHWVYDDKLLRISKSAFRKYLEEQKVLPSFVLDGLKDHFDMYEKQKVRLHAGVRAAGGQEAVLIIPIKPGTWLWDELEAKRPKPLKGEDHQVGLAVSPVEGA